MSGVDFTAALRANEEKRARRFLGLTEVEPLPGRHLLEERVRELRRDLGDPTFACVMRRVIGVPNPSVEMLPLSALAEAVMRMNAESEAQA